MFIRFNKGRGYDLCERYRDDVNDTIIIHKHNMPYSEARRLFDNGNISLDLSALIAFSEFEGFLKSHR